MKFNNVPKPGISLSGIHRSRTRQLTNQVDHPRLMPVLRDTPSDSTIHGEFPRRDCTRRDSPRPKRKSAPVRIPTRSGARSQRFLARHGVIGIERWGRNHSMTVRRKSEDITGGYRISFETLKSACVDDKAIFYIAGDCALVGIVGIVGLNDFDIADNIMNSTEI